MTENLKNTLQKPKKQAQNANLQKSRFLRDFHFFWHLRFLACFLGHFTAFFSRAAVQLFRERPFLLIFHPFLASKGSILLFVYKPLIGPKNGQNHQNRVDFEFFLIFLAKTVFFMILKVNIKKSSKNGRNSGFSK